MNTSELQNSIGQGSVELLDVRTAPEFNQSHIAGARHIPLDKLESAPSFEQLHPEKLLCIICQSGKRAAKAQQHLQERFGVRSQLLDGGMNAWVEAGGQTESTAGTHSISSMRQVQIVVGVLNLLGIGLALLHSPWWLALPCATGTGMLVAGITGWCGLALLLANMPWNRPQAASCPLPSADDRSTCCR